MNIFQFSISICIVYIGIDMRYKPWLYTSSLRYLLKLFCKDDLNFNKLAKLERQTIILTTDIRIVLNYWLLNTLIGGFYTNICFWILALVT